MNKGLSRRKWSLTWLFKMCSVLIGHTCAIMTVLSPCAVAQEGNSIVAQCWRNLIEVGMSRESVANNCRNDESNRTRLAAFSRVDFVRCVRNHNLVGTVGLGALSRCSEGRMIDVGAHNLFPACVRNHQRIGRDRDSAINECSTIDQVTQGGRPEFLICIERIRNYSLNLTSAAMRCSSRDSLEAYTHPRFPACIANIERNEHLDFFKLDECGSVQRVVQRSHPLFLLCLENTIAMTSFWRDETEDGLSGRMLETHRANVAASQCNSAEVIEARAHPLFRDCISLVQAYSSNSSVNPFSVCRTKSRVEVAATTQFVECLQSQRSTATAFDQCLRRFEQANRRVNRSRPVRSKPSEQREEAPAESHEGTGV